MYCGLEFHQAPNAVIQFSRNIHIAKTALLLLICIMTFYDTKGQDLVVEKTLRSRKDSSIVAFANVFIKNSAIGTYSNTEGEFRLECDSEDIIIISSIGYENATCGCNDLNETLFLEEKATMLSEVVIAPDASKAHLQKIGFLNEKKAGSYIGPKAAALYVENTELVEANISKVYFNLSKVKWVYEKPKPKFHKLLVRLKLFEKDVESGRPSDNILDQNIIAEVLENQKKVTFDINELHIKFPENGIFVGIEFIGYYEDDEFIAFDAMDEKKTVQYQPSFSEKHNKAKSWVRLDYGESWKLFDFSPNMYPNFNFGIEITSPSP